MTMANRTCIPIIPEEISKDYEKADLKGKEKTSRRSAT